MLEMVVHATGDASPDVGVSWSIHMTKIKSCYIPTFTYRSRVSLAASHQTVQRIQGLRRNLEEPQPSNSPARFPAWHMHAHAGISVALFAAIVGSELSWPDGNSLCVFASQASCGEKTGQRRLFSFGYGWGGEFSDTRPGGGV